MQGRSVKNVFAKVCLLSAMKQLAPYQLNKLKKSIRVFQNYFQLPIIDKFAELQKFILQAAVFLFLCDLLLVFCFCPQIWDTLGTERIGVCTANPISRARYTLVFFKIIHKLYELEIYAASLFDLPTTWIQMTFIKTQQQIFTIELGVAQLCKTSQLCCNLPHDIDQMYASPRHSLRLYLPTLREAVAETPAAWSVLLAMREMQWLCLAKASLPQPRSDKIIIKVKRNKIKLLLIQQIAKKIVSKQNKYKFIYCTTLNREYYLDATQAPVSQRRGQNSLQKVSSRNRNTGAKPRCIKYLITSICWISQV